VRTVCHAAAARTAIDIKATLKGMRGVANTFPFETVDFNCPPCFHLASAGSILRRFGRACQNRGFATFDCKRNIEMTPLCKIEVTPHRVLGSREVRRGGVVDEQAGVRPS
jgi:hypothetical protein